MPQGDVSLCEIRGYFICYILVVLFYFYALCLYLVVSVYVFVFTVRAAKCVSTGVQNIFLQESTKFIVWHRIMLLALHHLVSYHTVSYCLVLCHTTRYRIISWRIVTYCVVSCCVVSYRYYVLHCYSLCNSRPSFHDPGSHFGNKTVKVLFYFTLFVLYEQLHVSALEFGSNFPKGI